MWLREETDGINQMEPGGIISAACHNSKYKIGSVYFLSIAVKVFNLQMFFFWFRFSSCHALLESLIEKSLLEKNNHLLVVSTIRIWFIFFGFILGLIVIMNTYSMGIGINWDYTKLPWTTDFISIRSETSKDEISELQTEIKKSS